MRHACVRDCPGPLFPATKSVRLSGVMNEKLVRSIISHHPDRLEELSIDDVQHWDSMRMVDRSQPTCTETVLISG